MDSTSESLKWFFQQPAPRQVDEGLFKEALDVIFPRIIRVVYYLMPGIALAAMTTALVIMVKMTDLQGEWRMLTEAPVLSSGRVLDVKAQKGSKGSVTYIYRFEFVPPAHGTKEAPVKGVSFSGSEVASRGDAVQIEYIADDPRISRIAGCRLNPTPLTTIIAIPLLGIIVTAVPIGILRYKKRWLLRLLASGVCCPAFIEKVKPGPKGALIVEVRYNVEGVDVKSKTTLNGITGRKQDREWLRSLQESGQPAGVLVNREKPRSFFLLELLFRAREKNSNRFGM